MARKTGSSHRAAARRLSRGIVIGAACLLSACGRDALVDAAGRARPPGAPAQLVNPVCAGGSFQGPHTISTAVTWQASVNPHLIDGTVTIAPGGTLTIEPGAIVCFNGVGRLHSTGGRLVARGLPASPVLLTAYDPPLGWLGITLQGTPPSGSQIAHARVEHVRTQSTAIVSTGHLVFIDSSVVRRSGAGVSLSGANSRFGWSRVDTTTNRNVPERAAQSAWGPAGAIGHRSGERDSRCRVDSPHSCGAPAAALKTSA